MGLIRKVLSVSTVGMVDFRSDKERVALNAKQTRNAIRKQVAPGVRQANIREGMKPQPTSADWYPDPGNPGYRRYWDGAQWTAHVEESAPPTPPPPPQ